MNITHYISILDADYVAKNTLEKTALKYFQSIDRKLVEKDEIKDFKKIIIQSIDKINEDNKRCKPMKIYFDDNNIGSSKYDYILRDAGVVRFSLRAVTLTHLSTLPYKSISHN